MKANEVAPEQVDNLVSMIDGYAEKGGHHLNVNVKIPCLMPRRILRSIRSLPFVFPDMPSSSTRLPKSSRTTLFPAPSTRHCRIFSSTRIRFSHV